MLAVCLMTGIATQSAQAFGVQSPQTGAWSTVAKLALSTFGAYVGSEKLGAREFLVNSIKPLLNLNPVNVEPFSPKTGAGIFLLLASIGYLGKQGWDAFQAWKNQSTSLTEEQKDAVKAVESLSKFAPKTMTQEEKDAVAGVESLRNLAMTEEQKNAANGIESLKKFAA